jgi:hypothetical protein
MCKRTNKSIQMINIYGEIVYEHICNTYKYNNTVNFSERKAN